MNDYSSVDKENSTHHAIQQDNFSNVVYTDTTHYVQPQFITTTQHITINATYHNWSRNMSQLTQNITILTQNVTTQQPNLSQEFRFFLQHVTT